MTQARTPFDRVSAMNTAFNNPKGDYENINLERVRKQVHNIFDEYMEALKALGARSSELDFLKAAHQRAVTYPGLYREEDVDLVQVRDALCDIQVFALGAQHFMGVDGNADFNAVVDGVMTRFVKDEADAHATLLKHAANGITDIYWEGEYPTRILKSASDQPDAPKGKFLKSASYQDTVFPPVSPKQESTCGPCPCEDCKPEAQDEAKPSVALVDGYPEGSVSLFVASRGGMAAFIEGKPAPI